MLTVQHHNMSVQASPTQSHTTRRPYARHAGVHEWWLTEVSTVTAHILYASYCLTRPASKSMPSCLGSLDWIIRAPVAKFSAARAMASSCKQPRARTSAYVSVVYFVHPKPGSMRPICIISIWMRFCREHNRRPTAFLNIRNTSSQVLSNTVGVHQDPLAQPSASSACVQDDETRVLNS